MRRGARPDGVRLSSFAGVSLRSLRARPLRSLLTAGGIVLGVGMVFGVLLLVSTIDSTFSKLYDSIYGNADVVVSGEHGTGTVPGDTIEKIEAVDGVEFAAGDVVSIFRLVDEGGEVKQDRFSQVFVAGVDPRDPDTTDSVLVEGRKPKAGPEVQVPADWAEEQDLELGEQLRLAGPTGLASLEVVGMYEFPNGLDIGGYGTASMPVDTARRLMDMPNVWSEVTVVAEGGTPANELRNRLRDQLGGGVDVSTPAAKSEEEREQLQSLNVVLYFFSGIALFVGGFLILNSFNMTILQRIREIGTLRALGAGRGRIVRLVLGEALLLGLVGSALGLGLGLVLGLGLLEVMRSFGFPVGSLEITLAPAIAAVLTGLIATALGVLRPALRAGRIEPIRALTGGQAARAKPTLRRFAVGLVTFFPGLIGGGLFWFSDASETGGSVALIGGVGLTFMMLFGMVLLAPFVVLPIIGLLARPLRLLVPAEGRLAADSVQSNPLRTSATAAALLVALSVVVVNATIARSFVGSVEDELDRTLARDVTVQPVGYEEYAGTPTAAQVSRHVRNRIEELPEADVVAQRRSLFVPELPGGNASGLLVAFDPETWPRVDGTEYEGASTEDAMQGLAEGGVIVAKHQAEEEEIAVGDEVKLEGPSGVRKAPVVAIADTLDAGGIEVQISLDTMEEIYGVTNDSVLAIQATSPEERPALESGVEGVLADFPALEAISNTELKSEIKDQINAQFGFFNAIVAIAVLVGLLGIINTLSMSVIERTREIGVLRALGASRWSVRRTMADESLLIALAGSIAGIGAGLLVAFVWVIGLRGSTFQAITFKLPVEIMVGIGVLGIVMGVLAAILPARRAAKLDPLTAISYE